MQTAPKPRAPADANPAARPGMGHREFRRGTSPGSSSLCPAGTSGTNHTAPCSRRSELGDIALPSNTGSVNLPRLHRLIFGNASETRQHYPRCWNQERVFEMTPAVASPSEKATAEGCSWPQPRAHPLLSHQGLHLALQSSGTVLLCSSIAKSLHSCASCLRSVPTARWKTHKWINESGGRGETDSSKIALYV